MIFTLQPRLKHVKERLLKCITLILKTIFIKNLKNLNLLTRMKNHIPKMFKKQIN